MLLRWSPEPFRQTTRTAWIVGYRRLSTLSGSTADVSKSIDSILIANRGEIALRVARTAKEHGIRVTTLYTDPDALSQHTSSSPFTFNLGKTSGYLESDRIISLAQQNHCKALHPGYGFLSENSSFAKKCVENGIVFLGPPWKAIEDMGDKARSKEIMESAGVACVPGYHGQSQDPGALAKEADKIGYPVLIKAVRGGGGKGMRISHCAADFPEMLRSAKSEAKSSFGNDDVLIEKYITTPRHIEVQVFADKHGNCVALGERDCSIQRRHQKILEESPAPRLDPRVRKDIWEKARAAALAVGYEGAGTVEFIFDNDSGDFFFMEMNTRLQVEHPVTEMVTGLDLVHWQIQVAEGKRLPLTQEQVEQQISRRGHAIEARIYAENPAKGFIPDSGLLTHVRTPAENKNVRVDTGFIQGDEVTSHYDPMISKLICRGDTREEAVRNLVAALQSYEIAGPITNIEFLKQVCTSPDFVAGDVETGFIERHREELFRPEKASSEVLAQAAIVCFLTAHNDNLDNKTSVLSTPTKRMDRLPSDTDSEGWLFRFTATGQPGNDINEVTLQPTGPSTFSISVADTDFQAVPITAWIDATTSTLRSLFPSTQLSSTVILPSDDGPNANILTIFSRGRQYRLEIPRPAWLTRALGVKDAKNSVVAPMPCKVLRVDVQAGDGVEKDQPLLVIESMKMETTIRSPGSGRVKRVVHGEGDICAAGTSLVEFEEETENKS